MNNKDDKKYLVSVIIPCYNAQSNIEKTLKSLEKQSYKNFQVVIVNDGSTDDSDNIIRRYMEKTMLNIDYIIQSNGGVSVARNTGLNASTGKYIMFLDADDIYHADCIGTLCSAIESSNTDVAYCCYTRNIDDLYKELPSENKIFYDLKLNHMELLDNFMYRKGPCGFFNYIYKKSIITKYNILFTTSAKYGEDLEFTWKYLSHCKDGIFIDRNLYGYYDNPYSAVNTISWNNTDVIYSMNRVGMYLRENKDEFADIFMEYIPDRTIWALLKDFAKAKRKDLFDRLIIEQDTKKSMSNMKYNAPNKLIKISAAIFCISPKLFYFIIKWM